MHEEMPAFPTICSQLHSPSALPGNWERAASRDPGTAGQTGATLPTSCHSVAGAGARCPWEAASEGRRKSDWSGGGAHRELCASLSSIRRGSAQDSLQLCHQHTPAGHGEGFKQDRKGSEQPKAQAGIVHRGPGSVPEHRDTRVWHRFLCTFVTDPLDFRGTDPDLQNSSGEKLQNFKNN